MSGQSDMARDDLILERVIEMRASGMDREESGADRWAPLAARALAAGSVKAWELALEHAYPGDVSRAVRAELDAAMARGDFESARMLAKWCDREAVLAEKGGLHGHVALGDGAESDASEAEAPDALASPPDSLEKVLGVLLEAAIAARRTDAVDWVLGGAGADAEVSAEVRSRLLGAGLEYAAMGGNEEMVALLLERSKDCVDVEAALEAALGARKLGVVGRLIAHAKMGDALFSALRYIAKNGDEALLETAIARCASAPEAMFADALGWAVMGESLANVKRLCMHCDPSANDSSALRLAAMHGTCEAVKYLAERTHPAISDASEALISAAGRGEAEMVEILLPLSDPAAGGFKALRMAARAGCSKVAERLALCGGLEEKGDGERDAFGEACAGGHAEAAKVLAPRLVEPGKWELAAVKKGLRLSPEAARLREGLNLCVAGASPLRMIAALAPAPSSAWAPSTAKMLRKRCGSSKKAGGKGLPNGQRARLDGLEEWLDGYELAAKDAGEIAEAVGSRETGSEQKKSKSL